MAASKWLMWRTTSSGADQGDLSPAPYVAEVDITMIGYTVQLAGHLDARWEAAFDGFTITHSFAPDRHPITLLTGAVPDQSALYGLISRLRDIGVTLISVQPAEPDPTGAPQDCV